ncbi:hypothetical protein MKW92_029462 [Papaver armeniacum]|nr:hypothetical protein MKW92_029462 [Papaver armeniacum]
MGCASSKLENEEAVKLCKDRRKFIQQAVEQRIKFASGHNAYIQSLKRVSAALRNYVEGDEPRELFIDSFTTPVKKTSSPGIISMPSKSYSRAEIGSETNTTFRVNYFRSGGNSAVSVEERPHSPETVRIESFPPMNHYGIDGFFSMQSPPDMNVSSYYTPSPNRRPSFPPQSPQNSQWDFFWNPFTSLDTYGYPTRESIDHSVMDDDISGIRQVREEEGIPDLEEEGAEEGGEEFEIRGERIKIDLNNVDETIVIEDCDDDESDSEADTDICCDHEEVKGLTSQFTKSVGGEEAQSAVGVGSGNKDNAVGSRETNEETPGYTVYVNRRPPTSMAEVIKDIESQFMIVCNSMTELSTMLEASKVQYASTSNEMTAMKMLNPVALIRSASSSRSSSSRFFLSSSSSKDDGCDSSSEFSEESCMISGSHQSTLDRLYAWEKKLYGEVKSGERIRIAYEKKCMQLRSQDVKGEDPNVCDKTRAAIRDLHTQIKVSIHSVEAVAKRIETLRDEELQPQLVELVQGLARMWKVMAACHQAQKRTLDEAKLLLASSPSKLTSRKPRDIFNEPHRLAQSAVNLEIELLNWKASFESWVTAQRSYVNALKDWLLRCMQCDTDTSKLPISPRRSSGAPAIFGICIQWSRFLDAMHEGPVQAVVGANRGIDLFAAGMGSLYTQQLKDDSRRSPSSGGSKRFVGVGTPGGSKRYAGTPGGSKRYVGIGTPVGSKRFGGVGFLPDSCRDLDIMEVGGEEEEEVFMTAERTAEVAMNVLCAGMSVAISSLSEFAICSADGYAELVNQWEIVAKTNQQGTRSIGV